MFEKLGKFGRSESGRSFGLSIKLLYYYFIPVGWSTGARDRRKA